MVPDSTNWSPLWGAIPQASNPFTPETFRETLDGGQAFRWRLIEDGVAEGMWLDHFVRLKCRADGHVSIDPATPVDAAVVAGYLDLETDYAARIDALPWRSDVVVDSLRQRWGGLRLLRQPLEEVLLGFICSSTKQIVQIKAMLETLATRFGQPVAGSPWNRLPTWRELSTVSEEELRACALGYRARYVKAVADFLADHPAFLHRVSALPYPEAKTALISLPGVGEKVADCVLLFGDARWEAFPVDTWIDKILRQSYGLEKWNRSQLAEFARIHFGPHAGLVQQWMFAEARNA